MSDKEMRFAFAMSSFARVFRPDGITLEMRKLCEEWSESTEVILGEMDLPQVDDYFMRLWSTRSQ